MWIKRTSVNTKKERITYLQLMKTEYVEGRSRQRLVVNLGRADRVDFAKATALAKAISAKVYDGIDKDLLALLPAKAYGEVYILDQLFRGSGLKAFTEEAAASRGLDPSVSANLFALSAYYFLNPGRDLSFKEWLGTHYVPQRDQVTEAGLAQAFDLLLSHPVLPPDLGERRRRVMEEGGTCLAYAVDGSAHFLMDEDDLPLGYELGGGEARAFAPLRISEGPLSLADLAAARTGGAFLHGLSRKDLGALEARAPWLGNFAREGGTFEASGSFGYRETWVNGLRLMVLRSSPGEAPALGEAHREARDLLLSTSDLPADLLIRKYLVLGKIQDVVAAPYLPSDLAYLERRYTAAEVRTFVTHLQFIQLFYYFSLERDLRASGLSVEETFSAVRDVVAAEVSWGRESRLVHSTLSEEQETILKRRAAV